MTYDFSFERKSVAALLTASVLLCAFVFVAGLVVGAGWGSKPEARAERAPAQDAPQPTASQAAKGAQPASQSVASAAPREPVLYDEDPSRREYASEGYGPRAPYAQPYNAGQPYAYGAQPSAAEGYAAQSGARGGEDYAAQDGYAARAYAPRGYAARGADSDAAPAAAPAATGRGEAARLSARNIDPDPRLVQESEAGGEAGSPPAPSAYSVQVGAYTEEGEARRVARDLEDRGYAPRVFSAQDSEARTWFAVRIGSYANAREANAAASNFSKQEGRKASVRPTGAL
jgi:SPOR domain